jgi:hyperosmotically inducible protein
MFLLLISTFIIPPVKASPTPEDQGLTRTERKIHHELVMLPFYDVFDNLQFRVEGSTVILTGQVTRPALKSSAETVVKGLEEVESVDNQIEVLPVSSRDDDVRMAVYRAIYYNPSFTRYAIRAVPPIHIIVKNGNVTLEGVVATEADSNLAQLLARGVPGAFSLTNNLVVEDPS